MNQFAAKPEAAAEVTPQDPLTFRTRNNKEGARRPVTETTGTADFTATRARQSEEGPLATQKDLIELHKRMVTMFTTLNQGLSDSAAQRAKDDRAAVIERLETMERSVSDIEGALRIELPPTLEKIVQSNLPAGPTNLRGRWLRRIGLMALLGATIGLSVTYHAEITSAFNVVNEFAITKWQSLSPFGDIHFPGD